MAKAFRDLLVWQIAMELAVEVYRLTELFPREETYGLISQMRRSSVAIASNIAEGSGRNTKRDFAQFVSIARGSNYELETQLLLAVRLTYIGAPTAAKAFKLSADVGKLLKGLLHFLLSEQPLPTERNQQQATRNTRDQTSPVARNQQQATRNKGQSCRFSS